MTNRPCLLGLDRYPRLVAGAERLEQHASRPGHVSNRGVERILVRAGRSVEAADLADELKRCLVQLLIGGCVLRMPQPLDVPAHVSSAFPCLVAFRIFTLLVAQRKARPRGPGYR